MPSSGKTSTATNNKERDIIYEAVSALESLGYKTNEALIAVNKAREEGNDKSVEDLLKRALQFLSY